MAPSASGLSRQPLKLESSVRIWQESFTSPLVTGEGDGDNVITILLYRYVRGKRDIFSGSNF